MENLKVAGVVILILCGVIGGIFGLVRFGMSFEISDTKYHTIKGWVEANPELHSIVDECLEDNKISNWEYEWTISRALNDIGENKLVLKKACRKACNQICGSE